MRAFMVSTISKGYCVGFCLTQLNTASYQRLLSHASRMGDFAYLGSDGSDGARGNLSGFSAMALSQITLPADNSYLNSQQLAERMEDLRSEYRLEESDSMPALPGGWLGILSYELGYAREKRLANLTPHCPFPMISAGFYLWTASHDRETGEHWLWIHPRCPQNLRHTLNDWLNTEPPADNNWQMLAGFAPRQTPENFRAGVQAIRDYIQAGDCYQANLSQEFSGRYQGDPWQAFQALSRANPTPYSAFLRVGGAAVMSVSPERFLDIRQSTVRTSPIKGTRPRGKSPEQDAALANELLASEKDRAENLMIVDLLRNDLGLNAAPGSVTVEQLFALESYRNVHHLVSHIRSSLKAGTTPIKALIDAFPGGSITGAPKIRAMEIIRELEPHWRGPYCGSVFYYGLDGRLDSNIAIRTLLCEADGTIRCWGGGGIVVDSEPEAEYQETLAKVQPLMQFLENLKL